MVDTFVRALLVSYTRVAINYFELFHAFNSTGGNPYCGSIVSPMIKVYVSAEQQTTQNDALPHPYEIGETSLSDLNFFSTRLWSFFQVSGNHNFVGRNRLGTYLIPIMKICK